MSSAASVKRRPVYCGCCSMNLTNAVRIRCAQLQPQQGTSSTAATPTASTFGIAASGSSPGKSGGSGGGGGSDAVPSSSQLHIHEEGTKKHDPLDSLTAGPRKDGMVPVCDEFDICGSCFTDGKEVGRHKRWHDYRVVVRRRRARSLASRMPAESEATLLKLKGCMPALSDATRLSHLYR
jgi:transcriptional adapter 2-alpha